ncbi:hypothetical protein X975_15671, partial [Stegodyphus mimosarum]
MAFFFSASDFNLSRLSLSARITASTFWFWEACLDVETAPSSESSSSSSDDTNLQH